MDPALRGYGAARPPLEDPARAKPRGCVLGIGPKPGNLGDSQSHRRCGCKAARYHRPRKGLSPGPPAPPVFYTGPPRHPAGRRSRRCFAAAARSRPATCGHPWTWPFDRVNKAGYSSCRSPPEGARSAPNCGGRPRRCACIWNVSPGESGECAPACSFAFLPDRPSGPRQRARRRTVPPGQRA